MISSLQAQNEAHGSSIKKSSGLGGRFAWFGSFKKCDICKEKIKVGQNKISEWVLCQGSGDN